MVAAALAGQACGRHEDAAARNVRLAAECYAAARTARAEGQTDRAKELLRETLRHDEYHGGAHNDLGVYALDEDRLHDAATHFELARKLLPGDPQPRCNLAIVLTRSGRHPEALAACRAALEIQPHHVPTLQTLAMIQIRHQLPDPGLDAVLDQIIARGETKEWREWATLAKLKRDEAGK
jgi:tetratricopeptide (TPR) repeat protein